jgi:hypothetical protein
MGLSINRSTVESQGGRLWATANEGRGATFHFTLPTAAEILQVPATAGNWSVIWCSLELPRGDTHRDQGNPTARVLPRLTRVAGFGLASGMFSNTALPETAAEFLRHTSTKEAGGTVACAG